MSRYLPIIFGLALIALLSSGLNAQINFDWGSSLGSSDQDRGITILKDSAGNIYNIGNFSANFDADPGPDTSLMKASLYGEPNLFIIKYSPAGNFIWAKQTSFTSSSLSSITVNSATIDQNNFIYITGQFRHGIDFDPSIGLRRVWTTYSFGREIFVLKLDTNANFIWVKNLSSLQQSHQGTGRNISIDTHGDILVTGEFTGTIDFNPNITVINNLSASFPNKSSFVLKLNSNGQYIWAKSIGNSSTANLTGIHARSDGNGSVYHLGVFDGNGDFDPGLNVQTMSSTGGKDVFITKLDSNGNYIWSKSFGGLGNDYIGPTAFLIVDTNLYLGGFFEGIGTDLDPDSTTQYNVSSNGLSDAYLMKLDTSGSLVWVKNFGGLGRDYLITLDQVDNKIVSAGYFSLSVDFDPGASLRTKTSNGQSDGFIHIMDTSGTFINVGTFGGSNNETIRNITVSNTSFLKIYSTGYFESSTMDVDPQGNVYTISNTNPGFNDFFTLKYIYSTCTTAVYSSIVVSSCDTYTSPSNYYTWTASGIYKDTLVSSMGCDSVLTINLSIIPSSSVNTAVTQLGSTLNASASSALYQWIDCDNGYSLIPSATNQSFTPLTGGNYAVVVTENGCSDTSHCFRISIASINEQNDLNVNVYPNPTTGNVYVEFEEVEREILLNVRNALGQVVFTKVDNNTKFIQFEIEQKNGIYFLELITDNSIIVTKIVLKK